MKDVPWYAVSLGCDSFEDGKPVVRVSPRKPGLGFRLEDVLPDRI
jgi:hypothetical protein